MVPSTVSVDPSTGDVAPAQVGTIQQSSQSGEKSAVAAIVAAVVSAVASIAGVAINNSQAKKRVSEQNEYNSPANQLKRYEEAGLNPNLIYGTGASSAGNQSQPASSQGFDSQSLMPLVNTMLQLPQIQQSIRESQSRMTQMAFQNEEIRANTLLKMLDYTLKSDDEVFNASRKREIASAIASELGVRDLEFKVNELNPVQLANMLAEGARTTADRDRILKEIDQIGKSMDWTDQQIKESKQRVLQSKQWIDESKSRSHLNYMNAEVAGWNRDFLRDTYEDRKSSISLKNQLDNQSLGNRIFGGNTSVVPAELLGSSVSMLMRLFSRDRKLHLYD